MRGLLTAGKDVRKPSVSMSTIQLGDFDGMLKKYLDKPGMSLLKLSHFSSYLGTFCGQDGASCACCWTMTAPWRLMASIQTSPSFHLTLSRLILPSDRRQINLLF